MSQALYTDRYTLTMSQSFYKHGQHEERVAFDMFVRSLPKNRGFLLVAGLESVLDYLENFKFTDEDIDYLREDGFEDEFLEYLRTVRFTGTVHAMPEGTVVAAQTPLLRLEGTRLELTIIESAILTMMNHQTMLATKAARVTYAAAGRPVFDFALRRLHGLGASDGVARSAFIAGCQGTSSVEAARILGIKPLGTMAHHYILRWSENHEQKAFEQYLTDYPDTNSLLIDTYDTVRGAHRAVAASIATGIAIQSVRLDSGDLTALSIAARQILNAAGMHNTKIVASNDLDEYSIEDMIDNGCKVDSFGVGTSMGVSKDAPSLGGVYKLVHQTVDGVEQSMMKKAPGKQTDPGVHQVFRTLDGDTLDLDGEGHVSGEALLKLVVKDGARQATPTLTEIRDYAQTELERLPIETRRLQDPVPLQLNRSARLLALRAELGDTEALLIKEETHA